MEKKNVRVLPGRRKTFAFLIVLLPPLTVSAQQFSPAIEDNSFLIEEAYNQETRVVQHILNFAIVPGANTVVATFTQEWPVGSQTHQLSYTIPYQRVQSAKGWGDVLLNYRYQLFGEGDPVWCAPRFSLSLPTGNQAMSLGAGVVGVQCAIPVSKRWSNTTVSHFNFGVTTFPDVKWVETGRHPERKTLTSFSAGASGIYLLTERVNLMVELLHNESAGFGPTGDVRRSPQTTLSPEVRFAINLPHLQIVPGFAVPVTFTPTDSEIGLFFYLSFEHPY